MKLPLPLLNSLVDAPGYDRQAFEIVHQSNLQVTSIRVNPCKTFSVESHFPNTASIPWTRFGYYLDERPSFTFDPLFHAGCYYVQEASSMFLEHVLRCTGALSAPIRILDLCAAPGGKSTHIQSLVSNDSLVVSNEVIRSRASILTDNIVKWGGNNTVVTNNDPRDFAKLGEYFDVIVIDAPCSGSGLFRRDPEAIDEWSENNVALCSQRQQRIIADVFPALKKNGILVYSTCSYSMEEDEDIARWIIKEFPFEYIPVNVSADWRVVDTASGYRFWPDKVKGEGFFISAFRKMKGGLESREGKSKSAWVNKNELKIISDWMYTEGNSFIKKNESVYAWPEVLSADISYILGKMKVIYSGTFVGEMVRDKLIPSHALALSGKTSAAVEKIELSKEDSIRFLQRKDLVINGYEKGWKLVTFKDHVLGWVNVLANRVNNYYPKELRILKEI